MRSPFSAPEIVAGERRQKREMLAQRVPHLLDAVPAMRSSAPPSRSRAADTTRSWPLRRSAPATHELTMSVAAAATSGPVMTAVSNTSKRPIRVDDGIDVRLEHERVEEDPLRAAPDVEPALVARERPALARGMPARCDPVDHDEARIGVQVVSLRLSEVRARKTHDRIRHHGKQRIGVHGRRAGSGAKGAAIDTPSSTPASSAARARRR